MEQQDFNLPQYQLYYKQIQKEQPIKVALFFVSTDMWIYTCLNVSVDVDLATIRRLMHVV